LNPRPPAPQAGVIIRDSSLKTVTPALETKSLSVLDDEPIIILGFHVYLDKDPALAEYNRRIINTLEQMAKNGRRRWTIKNTTNNLRTLNRYTDLMNPELVKTAIANALNKEGKPASQQAKHKMTHSYDYFVKANDLTWEMPRYTIDEKVPITPTLSQAEAIMRAATSTDSATIFRILMEAGFEGEELHCTTERDIDTEQGIITEAGHKMHNGRAYKLKAATADMLRLYMSKHHREHPFCKPTIMGDSWRDAKKRAAKELNRPDLLKIPLKGLRNLSGILHWKKTRDPWLVMLHMGHKRLSTTQHYLQGMTVQMLQDPEFTMRAVQLGTQNTIKEIMELAEAGFTKFDEADGFKFYRKPK
jgi:hypothetical protein